MLRGICVVSLQATPQPVLNTGSPNKLFDGLAAGKLIITNFEGWIKDLIESNQCGFAHDPQQPEIFEEKIRLFISNKKLLKTYQQNSRKLALSKFEKAILIKKLISAISN